MAVQVIPLVGTPPVVDLQTAGATGDTTTTSATFEDMADTSVTTAGGKALDYMISAGCSINLSSQSTVDIIINVNGSDIANSIRTWEVSSNVLTDAPFILSTQAVVNIADGDIVKLRWRVDGGTATAQNRSMNILGVG